MLVMGPCPSETITGMTKKVKKPQTPEMMLAMKRAPGIRSAPRSSMSRAVTTAETSAQRMMWWTWRSAWLSPLLMFGSPPRSRSSAEATSAALKKTVTM